MQWPNWNHLTRYGSEYHAQCPNDNKQYGDRMVITPEQTAKGPPHVWCRFCGAWAKIETSQEKIVERERCKTPAHREPKIDEQIVDQLRSDLSGREAFFHSRGLSAQTIQRYQLGYHRKYNRYAIPCYVGGKLYGIKYRIDPVVEQKRRERGEPVIKYFSERGGINNVVFNDAVARAPVPYVLIDEGELDALLLTQHGFPTISPFSGNNSSVGWRPEWLKLIRHIPKIYVIAQNDSAGELITIARLHDLGRGEVISAPLGYKDLGEWLREIAPEHRTRELVNLLQLPPAQEELWLNSANWK